MSIAKSASAYGRDEKGIYQLRPGETDDYRRLLEALEQDSGLPSEIVNLWGLTAVSGLPADEILERCLFAPVCLAQAMGEREQRDPWRLSMVSDEMHEVVGNERPVAEKAVSLGPCRVIPVEYKEVTCRCIDLQLPADRQGPLNLLMAALMDDEPGMVTAYRNGYRWLPEMTPERLQEEPDAPAKLRSRGVYLITGGLGGIGLALAHYLASTVSARLVLLGRQGLPERNQWDDWLAEHDEDDRTSCRIRAVYELEAAGGEVMPVCADVADAVAMRSVLSQVQDRFGALHGVVHSAGVAADGIIQLKTRAAMLDVLKPKIDGTRVLGELLAESEMDFFVLCSSLASLTGLTGQVDYTAANAFQDAYAATRRHASNTYTVAINWDAWKESGMAVDAVVPDALEQLRAEHLADAITNAEGQQAFARVIASGLPQVVVSPRVFRQAAVTVAATERDSVSKTSHQRPELATAYVAPMSGVEEQIASVWCELLGIDKVGRDDDFIELGGHSVLALQLVSRLNEVLGVRLQMTDLFQYSTIAEFGGYVQELEQTRQADTLSALLDVIEQMPEDESETIPVSDGGVS